MDSQAECNSLNFFALIYCCVYLHKLEIKLSEIKLWMNLMLFLELDKINHTNLKESLLNNKKDFVCPVVAFLDEIF